MMIPEVTISARSGVACGRGMRTGEVWLLTRQDTRVCYLVRIAPGQRGSSSSGDALLRSVTSETDEDRSRRVTENCAAFASATASPAAGKTVRNRPSVARSKCYLRT